MDRDEQHVTTTKNGDTHYLTDSIFSCFGGCEIPLVSIDLAEVEAFIVDCRVVRVGSSVGEL